VGGIVYWPPCCSWIRRAHSARRTGLSDRWPTHKKLSAVVTGLSIVQYCVDRFERAARTVPCARYLFINDSSVDGSIYCVSVPNGRTAYIGDVVAMIARPFHTAVASTSAAVMVRPSERAHRASVSAPTGRLFMTFVVFLLGVSWVAADEYTNTRWPTLLLVSFLPADNRHMCVQKHLRYAHTINGDTPPPFTTSFLSPNDYLHAMTLPERPISEDTWAAMQLPSKCPGGGIEQHTCCSAVRRRH
jgi:hypothetical protein